MKGQEKIDYHNYDQINLTVKRQNADEVILSYGAFLWEKIEEKEDKRYHDILHLSFTRPHKIPNKDRLQLLQVHYETAVNERALLDGKKHRASQALLSTGLVLLLSVMLGVVALSFYLVSLYAVLGGVAFTVIQASLCVLVFVKVRKIRKKENQKFEDKKAEIEKSIDFILSEAMAITGVNNEKQTK
ncbi:MAG: hypothetical protein IJV95_03520 [Clostridia bacterium]|nr:hypothetical protein [Clostridia bacterium]